MTPFWIFNFLRIKKKQWKKQKRENWIKMRSLCFFSRFSSEMRSLFQHDSREQWIVFVVSRWWTFNRRRKPSESISYQKRWSTFAFFVSTINHVLIIRVLNAWTAIEAHKTILNQTWKKKHIENRKISERNRFICRYNETRDENAFFYVLRVHINNDTYNKNAFTNINVRNIYVY